MPKLNNRMSGHSCCSDKCHNYYVNATGGNDNNSGRSPAQAWCTLAKVNSFPFLPGDHVLFKRNEVWLGVQLNINVSGAADNYISFGAYGTGTYPIIDGNNWTVPGMGGNLISINGDYICLSDMEVRYSGYGGIYVFGNHNIVDHCYVHHDLYNGILVHGNDGVGIHGQNNIVENCNCWQNSYFNWHNLGGATSSALTASHQALNNIIRRNLVYENWGEGISVYTTEGPNTMEDNISHDNFTNIYISDADYTLCQRNLLYADPASDTFPWWRIYGIVMGDENFALYGNSHNNSIINNLVYGCYLNIRYWSGAGNTALIDCLIAGNTSVNGDPGDGQINISLPGGIGVHSGNIIRDNICRQDGVNDVMTLGTAVGITVGYQCFSKAAPVICQGPGDVTADPLLAETDTFRNPLWYKLQAGSPARGAGIALAALTNDYWQSARSSPPDIGAHEF